MKYILNKQIPIPLYYQLKQYLEEKIERGDLKPGEFIPSEREMSEQFGISRMTVRQALQELVVEGKLIREKGKGTVVAEPKINQGLLKLTSFSEDMLSRGMRPGAKVVDVSVKTEHSGISKKLRIGEDAPLLVITRVRMADEQPMALETTHLPLSRFAGLDKDNFKNMSIYEHLKDQYGVVTTSATQTIEVGMPNTREAELLKIERNVPVILIERVTFDQQREPMELVKSTYRGDRYKLYAELER